MLEAAELECERGGRRLFRGVSFTLGSDDPAGRIEELARLGGFERLRDFGVPEDDLSGLARAAADRPGARANPRAASPEDVEALLRSVW